MGYLIARYLLILLIHKSISQSFHADPCCFLYFIRIKLQPQSLKGLLELNFEEQDHVLRFGRELLIFKVIDLLDILCHALIYIVGTELR